MTDLLLDTTYLLPVFGVDVGLEGISERLLDLSEEYNVFYNPISIVEAKWIILRLMKRKPKLRDKILHSYISGLTALISQEKLRPTLLTDPKVEEISDKLLKDFQLRDYFDRLIYATAAQSAASLLTEDKDLHDLQKRNLPFAPVETISWHRIIATKRA